MSFAKIINESAQSRRHVHVYMQFFYHVPFTSPILATSGMPLVPITYNYQIENAAWLKDSQYSQEIVWVLLNLPPALAKWIILEKKLKNDQILRGGSRDTN